ncbi:flagellar biosynthetic protein FliO [Pueribacillus sp. YX66]|uniref:flagellar biosynthetic protein FliO n=1 Tax=Pueribacillus sp. YX66 TaxID=3229242 RepID=UPI00358D7323
MYKKLIFIISFCFILSSLLYVPNIVNAKDETVDDWLKTEEEQSEQTRAPSLEQSEKERSDSLSFPFFKMLFALAFVVFLIYALAKFLNKRTRAFSGSRSLESFGGISVGQNRSIQIIKVGERLLVVGVSDSIQLLKEISDEHEIQQFIQERETLEQEDLFAKSKQWLRSKQSNKNESFTAILDKQLKKIVQDRKNIYSNVKKKESSDE